jgi:hypothetical protein
MALKKQPVDPAEPVTIVVSTYWPTKIIKEVNIKENRKNSYKDEITLNAADAKYLYGQLKVLFGEAES